jgi:segregation and condensation protein B
MSEIGSKTVSSIESLLFTNGEPLAISRIAKLLGVSEEEVDAALVVLGERYLDPLSGLMLIRSGNLVEMVTLPENAKSVESLIRTDREENLGKATVEVLAIIAYRGPVTRARIDAIRGVNCSFALRTLLLRGLIDRHQNPLDSREYEYTPSFRLLELLGISSLAELPGYTDLSRDVRIADFSGEQQLSEEDAERGMPS